MIDRTVLRLMLSVGVPIASALVIEQLPKTRVAQVPFAFQVEDQTLPPGTYAVKEAGLGRNIRIENEKLAAASTKFIAAKGKFGKPEPARLIFESYQGQYRLSEIWFEADGRGVVLRGKDLRPIEDREAKCVWLQ
jgi:hypothetical protein